jgi:hypothetical protein
VLLIETCEFALDGVEMNCENLSLSPTLPPSARIAMQWIYPGVGGRVGNGT